MSSRTRYLRIRRRLHRPQYSTRPWPILGPGTSAAQPVAYTAKGRVPLSPAVRWRPEHLTRKTNIGLPKSGCSHSRFHSSASYLKSVTVPVLTVSVRPQWGQAIGWEGMKLLTSMHCILQRSEEASALPPLFVGGSRMGMSQSTVNGKAPIGTEPLSQRSMFEGVLLIELAI